MSTISFSQPLGLQNMRIICNDDAGGGDEGDDDGDDDDDHFLKEF